MRGGRETGRALVVAIVVVALSTPAASVAAVHVGTTPAQRSAPDPVGVTRETVAVAGIVSTEATALGADVGAQARFARANRGKGVAGRSIAYLRTEPASDAATAEAAAARLGSEAFAVVPAVGPAVGARSLASSGVPFFGVADDAEWHANRTGFSIVGVGTKSGSRVAASPLGVQLRALLHGSGDAVTVYHDDDPIGAARAVEARASLRAAGFRAVVVVPVPLLPAGFQIVSLGAAPLRGPNVLLTTGARTSDVVAQLVASGSVGTIVVGPELYAPTAPAVANGLTVLDPIAPFETPTAANRRLAADVEAFAPGTQLTPAIAWGYWAADLFVRALARAGKQPTRERLLDALNGDDFTYEVKGTVGRSAWPEMHAQAVPCGSLLQSDGTRYLVVEPYRCAAPSR